MLSSTEEEEVLACTALLVSIFRTVSNFSLNEEQCSTTATKSLLTWSTNIWGGGDICVFNISSCTVE